MLYRVECPKCKTVNGTANLPEHRLLTLFIEIMCSACRTRVVCASYTAVSAGPGSHALELKDAQEIMRKLRADNARLEADLDTARARLEHLEILTRQ